MQVPNNLIQRRRKRIIHIQKHTILRPTLHYTPKIRNHSLKALRRINAANRLLEDRRGPDSLEAHRHCEDCEHGEQSLGITAVGGVSVPFGLSKAPASFSAAVASRGREVRTTEAVMVRGRSASWSSSGMGVACEGEERIGRLDSDILGFAKPDGFETLEIAFDL